MQGGLGMLPPGKLDALRVLLRPHLAQSGTTVIVVICTSLYLVRRVQTSEFPVLSIYYIGLLSLGQGHNVVRLNICAPRSLQHAARLETSWPGQSGYAI